MFYRSQLCRVVVGSVSVLARRTDKVGISHLLSYVEKDAIGPVQRDEAIALFGLVRTTRPSTVVEFGFFHGHSAFNFLCALQPDARLYSYDTDDDSAVRARRELSFDPRLVFIQKSQSDFDPNDIGHRRIDFAFFDASHDVDINVKTFRRILPCLAPEAIVAIHDTGLWEKSRFSASHWRFAQTANGCWITDKLYAHQPHEREFVNWIVSSFPQFGAIHLHSDNTLRHGLSLIQMRSLLPTEP